MKDWTVTVESAAGVAASAAVLEQVALVMDRDERAIDPALSVNTKTGVISATFRVDADNPEKATATALSAFAEALIEVGLAKQTAVPIEKLELDLADQYELVPA